MDRKKIFANRLKILRKNKQKTQKELSFETGIPMNTIINYENARRLPDFYAVVKLEKYFDTTASYLYGNDDIKISDEVEDGFTRVDLPTDYLFKRLCELNNDLINKKETLKNMKIHNEFSNSEHHYITSELEEEIKDLESIVDTLKEAFQESESLAKKITSNSNIQCNQDFNIKSQLKENSFKRNLKLLRKEKSLSQLQLAQMLNVDQTAISQWETNKTMPSIENLVKLSKIFDCEISDLI